MYLITTCASCAAPLEQTGTGVRVKQCSRCKTRYCSASCQRDHWKKRGGHKTECETIAADMYWAGYFVTEALEKTRRRPQDDVREDCRRRRRGDVLRFREIRQGHRGSVCGVRRTASWCDVLYMQFTQFTHRPRRLFSAQMRVPRDGGICAFYVSGDASGTRGGE